MISLMPELKLHSAKTMTTVMKIGATIQQVLLLFQDNSEQLPQLVLQRMEDQLWDLSDKMELFGNHVMLIFATVDTLETITDMFQLCSTHTQLDVGDLDHQTLSLQAVQPTADFAQKLLLQL